jgi:glycosyltransferase involved in cell wall biosynthesis
MPKELDNIKKEFDWQFYISHNNLPFKNEVEAWYHFRNVGYKEGFLCSHKKNNKILIVMPTYKRSLKIVNVIKMILDQTYTNWVLLIIDDGSSPKHKKVFNNIKKRYNSNSQLIFLENETNCHIGKTLNRGIQYFLDNEEFTNFTWISDDNEYYPNYLQELVIRNNFFTYSQYYIKKNNIIKLNDTQYKTVDNLVKKWFGCAAFMWTKSAIKEIGFYKENIHGCEDYDYIIRTFQKNSSNCNYVSKPLMTYIEHEDCLIHKNSHDITVLHNKIKNEYKTSSQTIETKILIVLNNKNDYLEKHTQLLKTIFNCYVIMIDESSNFETDIMNTYTKYTHIIWQNTLKLLPPKQLDQKYIYIVHYYQYDLTETEIQLLRNNNYLIDTYIFVSNTVRDIFEKNILRVNNGYIIENQISPIDNGKKELNGLFVSMGSSCSLNKLYELIGKFCNLDKTYTLEIYGIQNTAYFNELQGYLVSQNIQNIKLFTNTINFLERLKKAEYYCSLNEIETCTFEVLEAMALNKKILCSEERITFDQLRFYPHKSIEFAPFNKTQIYIPPNNIFNMSYLNVVTSANVVKEKHNGLRTIDYDTTDEDYTTDFNNGFKMTLSKGISALIRLKNEYNNIMPNIYSIYDVFDEIIVVDNNSTDGSKDILMYFDKYYDKISVYNYNVDIFLNKRNFDTVEQFYNWSLSKVTNYNVMKWDADFVGIQHNLMEMIDNYNLKNRDDRFCIWVSGLTLFYNTYINISSYYDEYRCFSKLKGFKWVRAQNYETSEYYVKTTDKRYINGYNNTTNKIWLSEEAKKMDLISKPIFLEKKYLNDYKEKFILDKRDINDNNIITEFKNEATIVNNNINNTIYLLCVIKMSVGGVETHTNILFNILRYFFKTHYLIYSEKNKLTDDSIVKSEFIDNIESYKNINVKIILSHEFFNAEDFDILKSYKNIELYGISHSDISYYNKYFIENNKHFKKIMAVNNVTINKLPINNMALLRNVYYDLSNSDEAKNSVNVIDTNTNNNTNNINILFFSRTSYDKNIIMLLFAIDEVCNTFKNVFLHVYDNIDETIFDYFNRLSNKEHIIFHEPILNANKSQIYSQYDFCILPSVSEGCSYNILESIYYDVPIICTNFYANDEIIREHLPMFNFIGDLNSINETRLHIYNYNAHLNSIGYDTDYTSISISSDTYKKNIFNQNKKEIVNKVKLLINNLDFYKSETKKLKEHIYNDFYNVEEFTLKLLSYTNSEFIFINRPTP